MLPQFTHFILQKYDCVPYLSGLGDLAKYNVKGICEKSQSFVVLPLQKFYKQNKHDAISIGLMGNAGWSQFVGSECGLEWN